MSTVRVGTEAGAKWGGMGTDAGHRWARSPFRDGDGSSSLRPTAAVVGTASVACLLALAVGLAATSDRGRLGLAAAAGTIGFLVLWRRNVGVLLGLLVLTQLGEFGGLLNLTQLGRFGDHPSKTTETAIFAIEVAILISYLVRRPPRRLARAEWFVFWVAGLGLTWWTFTAVRTVVFEGGTVPGVLGGGRDLAYLFFAAPLVMLVLKDERVRRGLIATLAAGAALYVAAVLLHSSGGRQLDGFLNIQQVSTVDGLSRLYTPVHYVGNLGAAFGIALALSGTTPRSRWLGALFASATILVIVLQLTRAEYFGLGIGTVLVCGAWALQGRTSGQRLFQGRVLVALAALAVVVIGLIVVPVAEESTVGKVSQRVSSGFEDLENGTGSVGRREEKADAILGALGGKWMVGLGFWTPSTRYFAGVPNGEIRDGDFGVLNIYATEGVVGVVVLYAPLVFLLVLLMAFPSWGGFAPTPSDRSEALPRGRPDDAWLVLGAGIWLAMVLASSVTLGDLSSRPGASVSSYVIGLALALLVTTAPHRPFSPWGHADKPS